MKGFRSFAFDAKKKASKFSSSKRIESELQGALRRIAQHAGAIVNKHTRGEKLIDELDMRKALGDYARLLTPWAEAQSKKLMDSTIKRLRGEKSYKEASERMGVLRSWEVFQREIDRLAKEIFLEQVGLITSIPIEAGERAQSLALEAATNARRADEVAAELMRTTEVSESRAILIARTETARVNTVFNKARAESVGSTHYVWRNMHDEAVRDSHRFYKGKPLDGQVFAWDSPPTLSDGMTGHPGTFPNCRCYAEPILPIE